jgi:hypothetical protein
VQDLPVTILVQKAILAIKSTPETNMNPIQLTHQRSIQQKDAFWREEAA